MEKTYSKEQMNSVLIEGMKQYTALRVIVELTTDFNPLHVNDEYAKKSIFKKKLVHGAFSSGLISAVIGMKLPGPGALYLDQYCKFKKRNRYL